MSRCAVAAPPDDPDGDGRWLSVHRRFVSDGLDKDPEVVFLGDSILQSLLHTDVWNEWFAPMHSLNFSIHKDRTQHVLWRVLDGELDAVRPRAVVVHAGTENLGDPAEDVASGVLAIVEAVRARLPDAHVVVLTLLPRGQRPNALRERNEAVNRLLAERLERAPMRRVELARVDRGFVQPDGTISHHDMHDYLLLTNAGCRKAFEPLHELLTQLLAEGEPEPEAKDSTPSE